MYSARCTYLVGSFACKSSSTSSGMHFWAIGRYVAMLVCLQVLFHQFIGVLEVVPIERRVEQGASAGGKPPQDEATFVTWATLWGITPGNVKACRKANDHLS